MALTDRQIDETISDRFRRWGRFLRRERATPLVVLGLRTGDNTLVVTTCEGTPDELIRDMLVAAAASIARGEVDWS